MALDTTSPDIPNCKNVVVEMGKLAMFQWKNSQNVDNQSILIYKIILAHIWSM
jgi:hypothetical protein